MTIEQAIDILIEHQEWRRGAEIPMQEPRIIGEAIDVAIELLQLQLKQ